MEPGHSKLGQLFEMEKEKKLMVKIIHRMPSHTLMKIQKVIKIELKDRKYLKKRTFVERIFTKWEVK